MVTQDKITLQWSTPCTRNIIPNGSTSQEQEDYREAGWGGGKEGEREGMDRDMEVRMDEEAEALFL